MHKIRYIALLLSAILLFSGCGHTAHTETTGASTTQNTTSPIFTDPTENTSDTAGQTEPTDPTDTVPTESTETDPTEPETIPPEITEPLVTEPQVTEPQVTEPQVTEPQVTEPQVTEPQVTEPQVTEPQVTEPEGTVGTIVNQKPMASVSMPITTQSARAEDGTIFFQYTYQSMSLILQDPDVANTVILDFLNRMDGASSSAEKLKAQAQQAYAAGLLISPYQYQIVYSPTRIDHGVFSIYGSSVGYSDSAHPDVSYLAANYDLITGEVLYLPDIFRTDHWADDITRLVIQSLEANKAVFSLYDDYETFVTSRFRGNLSKDEKWFFSQDGLCFYFAPYEIAPYATGTVIVEIPYTQLTGILENAYFPAEQPAASGNIHVDKFENIDLTQFTQISELVLDQAGPMVLIHTDNFVREIRISVSNLAQGRMETVVYAAYTLTPGDAIMLQLPVDAGEKVTLHYISGNRQFSQQINIS